MKQAVLFLRSPFRFWFMKQSNETLIIGTLLLIYLLYNSIVLFHMLLELF
ncbi:MAG: hypothetical protein JWO58_908 [Chitinophagaceae bacterium]|nr:hypothetical protein [Chitinophagaceae bacterium]